MTESVSPSTNATTLASYFKVSGRTIANWRTLGLPMLSRNRYDIAACIEWYADWKSAQAMKTVTGTKFVDEESASLRKLVAEAEMKEIQVAKERGELVNVQDSVKALERFTTPLRSALLGFPSRVSPYLVMVPSQTDAAIILESNIRDLMDRMAEAVEVEEPEIEEDDVEEE